MAKLTFYGGVNEIGGTKILLEIVRRIKPQVLIPVHSERPDLYQDALKSSGMDIILPITGNTVRI